MTIDVKKFVLSYDTDVAKLPRPSTLSLNPAFQYVRLRGTEDVRIKDVPVSQDGNASFFVGTLKKCFSALSSVASCYQLEECIIRSSTPLLRTLVLSETTTEHRGWLGSRRPRQAFFCALNFDYTEDGNLGSNPAPSLQTIHLSINKWWTSENFEVLLSMLQSRWSPLRSLDMAKALTGREMLRSFQIKCLSPAPTVSDTFLNALLGLKRP
jgi:hypothetical protein